MAKFQKEKKNLPKLSPPARSTTAANSIVVAVFNARISVCRTYVRTARPSIQYALVRIHCTLYRCTHVDTVVIRTEVPYSRVTSGRCMPCVPKKNSAAFKTFLTWLFSIYRSTSPCWVRSWIRTLHGVRHVHGMCNNLAPLPPHQLLYTVLHHQLDVEKDS